MTVSATAVAALLGRIALARFADQVDTRVTTAIVLLLAAGALGAMGLASVPAVLVAASITFGLTVGNVTTLSPIIVRREFGADGFGAIFGVASCGIQLATALGPSLYGLLHDAFGSYSVALITAATLDVAAAVAIFGRHKTAHHVDLTHQAELARPPISLRAVLTAVRPSFSRQVQIGSFGYAASPLCVRSLRFWCAWWSTGRR